MVSRRARIWSVAERIQGAALKLLKSEDEVREAVRRVAAEVSAFYGRRPLTIVGILTGSVVFLADLIRLLDLPLRVGVVQARSYRGAATEPGPLSIQADLLPEIEGRDVLLVDDIFDTGQTLSRLMEQLRELRPRSVRSAVLLRKLGRRQVAVDPDHVGFEIPNEFVVGCGLDYQDAYRNLPYIAALEASELAPGASP